VVAERRRFLATAGGAVAAVAATAVVDAPHVIAQPKVQWRMSTAWTPALDFHQGAAQRLAKVVDEMSGGRFRIEVFPGGQIMAPFACFDAASQGTIEAFGAVSSYWAAKEPALEWFMTVPFGMNPEGMAAWYHQGDGLKLWEEAYAPFNLVPRPGPAVAPQMAGWFRKKINTINDYKGVKMRIAGLGGKVVAKAGGTAVLTPAAEIYAALERGVIDASEWVCPHDDMMTSPTCPPEVATSCASFCSTGSPGVRRGIAKLMVTARTMTSTSIPSRRAT
jgi:TRAP-type mannitol/chloroaromatic compound transport system substrate-binding protein